MPALEELRAVYEPKGVRFLALSLEPDQAANRDAALELGLGMRVAWIEGEVLGPFAVRAVPSTVFVGRDGRIKAAVSGLRKKEFFEARVRDLVDD